jgi:hypothetical protein
VKKQCLLREDEKHHQTDDIGYKKNESSPEDGFDGNIRR